MKGSKNARRNINFISLRATFCKVRVIVEKRSIMTPESSILINMNIKIGTPIAMRSLVHIKEKPHRIVAVIMDM